MSGKAIQKTRKYSLLVAVLLYVGAGIGLIGCGGDDSEVYPPLVQPMFSAAVEVQEDGSLHMNGGTFLQYRGAGNDVLFKEESHVGCFGLESDDEDEYEVGSYENILAATVTLNGYPLELGEGYGKYNPGYRFCMPVDTFIVLQEGDPIQLVIDVPNEDEEQLPEYPLILNHFPYFPEEYSTIDFGDSLVLRENTVHWISITDSLGRSTMWRSWEWQEANDQWYASYRFENGVAIGDTMYLRCTWHEDLDSDNWNTLSCSEVRHLIVAAPTSLSIP